MKSFSWLCCLHGIVGILLLGFTAVRAEEPAGWRIWRSTAGSELEARLISMGDAGVVLEKRSGDRVTVRMNQLSAEDQEFLKTSAPDPAPAAAGGGAPAMADLGATPGQISEAISCQADPQWSYFLYLPKEFKPDRTWPVCFVLDPSGGSSGTLERYVPAADHLGVVLAASKESKNEFSESADAMLGMVKDVYARLPINRQLVIASGMSGGCRMAYRLSELAPPIAGILACGAGDGVYTSTDVTSYRPAKVPRGTVICSLMGTNDYNRREAVRSYLTYRKDSRLIWFPGNHDWAPPELIVEGLAHVLGEILRTSKSKDLEPYRADFAKRRLSMVQADQETAPWAAHRWAVYLGKFPSSAQNQSAAQSLAGRLAGDPRVKLATKAESAMDDFTVKYLGKGNTETDKTPDPEREKEAAKQAAAYESLPQADIFRRLGLLPVD